MMFGGGSPSWFSEAVALQKANPDALCITPFSGPPTVRGDLDISRHVGMPGVKNILRRASCRRASPPGVSPPFPRGFS